ncbi:MAG: recombinase family protein, partial [Clostridia bacterium]
MSNREVVVIPATLGTHGTDYKKKNLRVASYCRVSTDKDEQLNSFESQKLYYTNYIQSNRNWKFVGTYADEGISGATAKKRPDFMKMIHHCTQGKIDMIITKSLSRFSRNILDTISYIRKLKALNIAIFFEKENLNSLEESSELIFTILAGIAQEELMSLSKNVKMGKRMAMKEGKVNIQYSHLYAYEKGEDGKPKIIKKQAEIVKRIFTNYLMGKSTGEVAKMLNNDSIPSPKGIKWKQGTIRNIIKNEIYCGDVILQKTYILDPLSKKVKTNNGELPKIHIKNNHIGIISREMFQVAQLERSKRSGKTRLNFNNAVELKKYSGKHALNGLLICKDCKSEYRRAVWTKRDKTRQAVWRCASRLDYGRKYCENSITIDEVSLKNAILESINSTKKDRQKLIEIFTNELGKTMRDMANMDKVNILEIEAKIATLTAETMKIISNPENVTKMHLFKDELKVKS